MRWLDRLIEGLVREGPSRRIATLTIEALRISDEGIWPADHPVFGGPCNAYRFEAVSVPDEQGIRVGFVQIVSRSMFLDADALQWHALGVMLRDGVDGYLKGAA